MAKKSELARLQIQKRLLVAKSEIHRQTLELELERLRESTAWIQKGVHLVRSSLPFLAVGAPVAGYFVAKKRKGLRSLSEKGAWIWSAVQHIRSFWDGFVGARQKTEGKEDPVFSEHFRPG